jgi:hypothetical protein
MGDTAILRRIEWYAWTLTGLLTVGALVVGYPLVAAGLGLGGGLSVLHFKWLAFFLTAVLMPQKRPSSRIHKVVFGAYLLKYLLLGGTVYLLFRFGVVDPLGFLGGLSVIFVGICIVGIQHSMQLLQRPE